MTYSPGYYKDKARKERRRRLDPEGYAEARRRYARKARGIPEPTYPAPDNCECCGDLFVDEKSKHVDHDHKTGKFRGWLCHHCNVGIGLFSDSTRRLKSAIDYLRERT